LPDPFIDAQDLTDHLGRDVTADPGALIALDAACDICRRISDQEFNAATKTISLDGTDGDCLLLPQDPVRAVGTVLVNGGTITDYMVSDDGMLLRGTAGGGTRPTWPRGRQNVSLTYDYGYLTDDLPRDVRICALSIAERYVVQGVAMREVSGDQQIDYATAAGEVTPTELLILRKYRRRRS
jgi:hypothetical protein